MVDSQEDLDYDVDNIISQIKNQGKSITNIEKQRPELKKEDLENFVIENASAVITDSVEMIQELKLSVMAGEDSRMVEAVSELVKAVTGAIDSLSKLKLSDDKIKGQKEIKQMEIDAKMNNEEGTKSLTFSREEILSKLLQSPKREEPVVIDVEP